MERATSFAELAKSVSDLTVVVQSLRSEVEGIKSHLATSSVSVPQQVGHLLEPRPAPVSPFDGNPRLNARSPSAFSLLVLYRRNRV